MDRTTSILLIFLPALELSAAVFSIDPKRAEAVSPDWDLFVLGDCAFDDTKLEVGSDQTQHESTSGWYDTSWGFRKEIIIDNAGNASELTDYQVRVSLNSGNFAFSKARSDGADLRFTDSDGMTLIDYWVESYDESGQTAEIYVKVPTIPASYYATIYLYYGNPGVSSSSNGVGTFVYYDDFENMFSVNELYLTTPTYDSSGQMTHPSVVYFENGWNGYKYWQAMTPFPGGDEDAENPSIIASNDGLTWEVPAGLVNPVEPQPANGHNADPELVHNPETDELWLYYGEFTTGVDGRSDFYLKRTSDGINWSAKQLVLSSVSTGEEDHKIISPAVIYKDGDFYMWSVNAGSGAGEGCFADTTTLEFRTSADGENWSAAQNATISQSLFGVEYNVWHPEVVYFAEKREYWMLFAGYQAPVHCGFNALFAARSPDGLTWTSFWDPVLYPILGWDQTTMYRASFVYDNETIKLWYSAKDLGDNWHLGYALGHYDNLVNQNYWQWLSERNGTWTRSSSQAKRGSYSAELSQTSGEGETVVFHFAPEYSNTSFEWDMYDDMDSSAFKIVRPLDGDQMGVGLGVNTAVSADKYVYHSRLEPCSPTSVSRSLGWHKFGITVGVDSQVEFHIDDALVATLAGQYNEIYMLAALGRNSGITTYYIDDLRIRRYSSPEPAVFTAVREEEAPVVPTVYALAQNYPNPFNPVTRIRFELPAASKAELRVFDVSGRVVKTLVDLPMDAGQHTVVWNGRSDAGRSVASGIYFYRLEAGDFVATRKMVLLH